MPTVPDPAMERALADYKARVAAAKIRAFNRMCRARALANCKARVAAAKIRAFDRLWSATHLQADDLRHAGFKSFEELVNYTLQEARNTIQDAERDFLRVYPD